MQNIKQKFYEIAQLGKIFVLYILGFLLGIVILFYLGVWLSYFIANRMFPSDSNLSLLQTSTTIVLVFITTIYVYLTAEIVKQSKNEQKIAFIEKRLEKLYYPLQHILHSSFEYIPSVEDAMELGYVPEAFVNYNIEYEKIEDILPYQYLAKDELKHKLHRLLKILNNLKKKNIKLFTIDEVNLHVQINEIVKRDIKDFSTDLNNLIK